MANARTVTLRLRSPFIAATCTPLPSRAAGSLMNATPIPHLIRYGAGVLRTSIILYGATLGHRPLIPAGRLT
jgi:hypothetical protein